MRPGNLDVFIRTGAMWTRDIQVMSPDTPVEAQTLVAGDRIFVDGRPLLVHSVTTTAGRTTIHLGQGLWYEPTLVVDATALVAPAVPVPLLDAEAAFTFFPAGPYVNPLIAGGGTGTIRTVIPSTISSDGLTLTLAYTADETAALAPMEGASSWDAYVQTAEWDWQSILEGTLTVQIGDSR